MFWNNIIEKKTSHYLYLLSLLKKRTYPLEELTSELSISIKTLRRDLAYLQKNYDLDIETKKKVIWKNPQKYSECYKTILNQSPQFTAFCDALWQRPVKTTRTVIRKLNDSLLPYNIWIDKQTKQLNGPRALVFKLQLRYLQEFNQETLGLNAAGCWNHLNVPKISNVDLKKWQRLIVEKKPFEEFVKTIQPTKELSYLVYVDHQREDPFRQQQFYESHEQSESFLYQAACDITEKVLHYLEVSREFKPILQIRFFYVLVDLHIGIPITYYSKSQQPSEIQQRLIEISNQIKKDWHFFKNCSSKEVSLLLYAILKRIYPVSMGQPSVSIGLKLSGSLAEIEHTCVKLNQAIQFSHPIAFFPARTPAIAYDLLIVEGPPAYEDEPNEILYIEDPSFGDLIQLAVRYFPSKKGDTVFTIP